MVEKIRADAKTRMEKALEKLRGELSAVRTGKATAAILDSVRVEYYGSSMPLSQVASVSAPQPRTLVIQPWDRAAAEPIVKAIQAANLGFNPSMEGELIRVPIPPLTEERRHEFVKRCRQMAEEARIAVRNVRRDANDELAKAQKAKTISEDDLHRGQKETQKLTDEQIVKIDQLLSAKEKEILEG